MLLNTAAVLCGAFGHVSAMVHVVAASGGAVVPWQPSPCAVCLFCSPVVSTYACSPRCGNHRSDVAVMTASFSALLGAVASGRREVVEAVVAEFPECEAVLADNSRRHAERVEVRKQLAAEEGASHSVVTKPPLHRATPYLV